MTSRAQSNLPCHITTISDFGQGRRTRTSGLCIPSAALYQTELYPVTMAEGGVIETHTFRYPRISSPLCHLDGTFHIPYTNATPSARAFILSNDFTHLGIQP